MILFDLTLETPAENLALDEALLEEAEASRRTVESACGCGNRPSRSWSWVAARKLPSKSIWTACRRA